MPPNDPVQVVTDGNVRRVRIVTHGPADPVRILIGKGDPVMIVTNQPSDPIVIVEDQRPQ